VPSQQLGRRADRLARPSVQRRQQRGLRRLARADDPRDPLARPEQPAPPEGRDEAGLHQRRLAAAGRADHGQEALQPQALQQLVLLRLAPEELVLLVLPEGRHAGVRAGGRGGHARHGPAQLGAQPVDCRAPLVGRPRLQAAQDGQPQRQLDRFQEQRDDRPGRRLEPVGLGEQLRDLTEGVGEVGGREDQERAAAALDRLLELDEPGCPDGVGRLVEIAHPRLVQRVEQVAPHPGTVGLGVGDEQVVVGRAGPAGRGRAGVAGLRHRGPAAARRPAGPVGRRRGSRRARGGRAGPDADCTARA
jgi:hypothetical protein